ARLQQAGGKPGKIPGGINSNTPVSAAEGIANTKSANGAVVLRNTKAALYDVEENLAGWAVRNGDAQINIITDARSLEVLNNKNQAHKFILNEDGILAVGSISKRVNPKNLSHPVLAGGNDSPGVIAAGYLHRQGRTVYVVNLSGHYLPDYNRLKPVASMLENSFNLKVKTVKAGKFYHRFYLPLRMKI
ncbi:hypothetical protein ACQRKX_004680, partial [Enterobacter cloacae]